MLRWLGSLSKSKTRERFRPASPGYTEECEQREFRLSIKKQRGKLGKDLDLLLGGVTTPMPRDNPVQAAGAAPGGNFTPTVGGSDLQYLPLDQLQRGQFQPRRDFDEAALAELSDSIRSHGVLQPIVVRPVADERWEIVAGERRWRASQLAGKERIPAIIRDVGDEATIALALIENIQREDLNAIEEAHALHRLQTEFSLSQQEIADRVGKSRPATANLLRLLTLEPAVKTLVESRDLDAGHGKVLLALQGAEQVKAAKQVVKRGLSVRQTEALVKSVLRSGADPEPAPARVDPDVARLERDLSGRLGSPVAIKQGRGQTGKIEIRYSSLEELDGILGRIR